MQLECPHCHALLDFSDRRPSFCGYCGQSLSEGAGHGAGERSTATADLPNPVAAPTADFHSEAATLPGVEVSQPDEVHPETVGGYRLLRPIGSGGMGTVYETEEIASGRRVALKLVSTQYVASRDAVERFRREGRLASGLHHPRSVFVFATDEEAGRPYIVMELMDGATLQDLVKTHGPLPPAEAVAKILDVIEGLQEAHELGVIHRDVKPSNCFLEKGGRVKIGDFGLAKSLVDPSHLTKTGSFMGTALFASPEQIRADPVDQQTDVYSVAATLYFLLTGRAPHQTGDAAATMARIVADPAPPMRKLRPELPPALDRAVLRGLERSRERRWRNLEELRQALEPFLPERQALGTLGPRLVAHLIDWFLVFLFFMLCVPVFFLVQYLAGQEDPEVPWQGIFFSYGSWFFYFAVLEGIWGCSLGKRWLRLRVVNVSGGPPSPAKILLRTSVWFVLIPLPWLIIEGVHHFWNPEGNHVWVAYLGVGLQLLSRGVGTLLLTCTMRARNGYRGLHDWLSDTEVVRITEAEQYRPAEVSAKVRWIANPGRRFVAILIDFALFVPGMLLLNGIVALLLTLDPDPSRPRTFLENVLLDVPLVVYFVILEGLWGRSVGKRLMHLRVRSLDGCSVPGLVRICVRTLLFIAVGTATSQLAGWLGKGSADPEEFLWLVWYFILYALIIGCTMRPSNGWRGLHEVLSGTRVQVLPWPGRRELRSQQPDRLTDGLTRPETMPERVGSFVVEGAARWNEKEKVLLAEDPALGRKVIILLRPASDAAVHATRRDISRPTRLRWLGSGQQGNWGWDAFICPTGFPLADAVLPDAPLTWPETKPILRQLADELTAACADGTLPQTLAVDQVWIHAKLRVQLLGTALEGPAGGNDMPLTGTDEERTLSLLRQVAVLALEGRLRSQDEPVLAVRAPLPEHARRILDRLLGVSQHYTHAEEVQADLVSIAGRPAEITWRSRTARLAVQALLHSPGAVFLFGWGGYAIVKHNWGFGDCVFLSLWPALWVLWAFAWRGGISLPLMGMALVRASGKKAARLQCAWRTFVLWAPVTGLLLVADWLSTRYPDAVSSEGTPTWHLLAIGACLLAAAIWPMVCVATALLFPARALHDRLAGTYLVPR